MVAKSKTAKLIIGTNEVELPIHSPSAGADVIDVSTLYHQAGVFTSVSYTHLTLPTILRV